MREKCLRWAILLASATAATLNVLYLAGVCPKSATNYGFLLLIACWAGLILLRRPGEKSAPAADTPLERARGMATLIFAAVWLLSTGMTFFWGQ